MMKKYTIITVCYNSGFEIEKTIKSVKNQTFDGYEYLIIDGGSTDETLNIIKHHKSVFGDKCIFISEKDDGIYNAMNKGIDLAQGEWIIFLNAGDQFYDENVLCGMNGYLDEEYGVICGGTVYSKGVYSRSNKAIKTELPYVMPTCHQSMAWRSDLLKQYKYDEKYRLCADRECLTRMHLDGIEFSYIDLFVSIYDCNGVSSNEFDSLTREILIIAKNNGMTHRLRYWLTICIWLRDRMLVRLRNTIPKPLYVLLNQFKLWGEGWEKGEKNSI